jgi:hypothetical protein
VNSKPIRILAASNVARRLGVLRPTIRNICAGDFTKMRFATGGEGSPVAVIIDPFTAKKESKIEILVSLLGDVSVLREEVFCVNTDSAIQ